MTLTQILQKIREAFYTKKEIDSMGGGTSLSDTISQKADKSDLNNYLPLTGGLLTGATVGRNINDGIFQINGGTDWSKGASVSLFGMNSLEQGTPCHGHFLIDANDGTTWTRLQGTPTGSLTWGSKNLDVIEEQGDGYIRYSNGIQICWGSISWTSSCSKQWGSFYETSSKNASYAKSFATYPSISAHGSVGEYSSVIEYTGGTSATTPTFWLCRGTSVTEKRNCFVRYLAIGRWK